MRSLIISIVLLLLVVTGVIINIIYVSAESDSLISIAESLPLSSNESEFADCKPALDTLHKHWYKAKKIMTYFIDYREIDKVDIAYTELENSHAAIDGESFTVYRAEFIHAVRRLREISIITLDNIL